MIMKDHLGNEYPSMQAMANAYGIAQRTLSGRLSQKMSIEEALTTPVQERKRGECEDHLGNKYPSKKEMCKAYGISTTMFFGRIGIGWSIEKALTTPIQKLPSNTKTVTDHKGQEFESVSAMCKHWGMTRQTFNARVKQGWSVEDALTKPKKEINVQTKKCKDHLGNEYPSLNEMCRNYGITRYMFQARMDNGWDLERALTESTVVNAVECSDGFGNTFPTIKDMCNYYNIPVCYLQGHIKTVEDTKKIILNRFKKGKTIGDIHIKKRLDFPYYLIQQNDTELIMTFDQILYLFHDSDHFEPLPKTKVEHKHITNIKRKKFPYYNVTADGKTAKWSYWDIIAYNKESNFGLSVNMKKKKDNPIITVDHLGNQYPSMAAMLRAYDIGSVAFRYRLNKLGMSLEEALTSPKKENLSTAIPCEDHLGNKFESKAAMCDYWRMPRPVFFRRVRSGWSLEKALTEPITMGMSHKTRMVYDHKGNAYYSLDEMCKKYNISRKQYIINIRNNCSIEEALTTVTEWTVCKDHLGNEYRSINEMCANYGTTKTTLRSRLELGWTLQEVLENPDKKLHGQQHTDHLGNTFPSKEEMLKYHGVSYATYTHRKKVLKLDLKECLAPENRHIRVCTDHKGNQFSTLRDMLLYWNSTNSIYASKINRGRSTKEALTNISKRKTHDFGPGVELSKRLPNDRYEIIFFGEKQVWDIDKLFDYYRKSYLPNEGKDLIVNTDK